MTVLNINKRTVTATNRNGRINPNNGVILPSTTTNGAGSKYEFKNGLFATGGTVTMSGKYTGYTENIGSFSITGGSVTIVSGNTVVVPYAENYSGYTHSIYGNALIKGNLFVDGNISASKEVTAYFASQISGDVLNNLSTIQPLYKSGTTIGLNYNSNHFTISGGYLCIKDGVGGVSSYNDLTDKPTLFSGNYNDLINKPTLFSGNYNDLTNKPVINLAISGSTDYSSYFNASKKALSVIFGQTDHPVPI